MDTMGHQGSGAQQLKVELLVLPKRCRSMVLKLAHDVVPLASHLRKEKTGRHLLRQFFGRRYLRTWQSIAGGARHARDQHRGRSNVPH